MAGKNPRRDRKIAVDVLLGHTLERVASENSLTRERVRQIVYTAVKNVDYDLYYKVLFGPDVHLHRRKLKIFRENRYLIPLILRAD